jgi:hypothetical protein
MWKWSHYAIVEGVEPFKLHPTSMSYIYKVFEHLIQLWMGIWQHIHTITTTDISPDLGELAEILDEINVKTIPIRYHWGCGTFQTASHIHVIHILGVWTPTQLWMGIWQHTHTVTHREVSPDLGKFSEIIYDVNVEMIPRHYRWGGRTFQTASHIYVIHI